MKNFRLLLKNSVKSLWNSRGLVTQFTMLTTIATVVVSSVSLGNFSLRNAMDDFQKESNLSGFSIESKKSNDFATYNLINSSNKLIDSLEELALDNATSTTKIYNPLINKIDLQVNNTPYQTYGFFDEYSNEHDNGQFYVDTQDAKDWNGIVFSKLPESLSIITKQMDSATYSKRLVDIFTLYNNILPPSPKDVQDSKFEIFFDPNIYAFNPWTLVADQVTSQLKVNDFGIVQVEGFENTNTNMLFNHGVFDKEYSYIVGTDNSFLDKNQMSDFKSEMQKVNKDTKFSIQYNEAFSNNYKQPSRTQDFANNDEFIQFLDDLYEDDVTKYYGMYNVNFFNYLNSLNKKINTFLMDSKKFRIKYSIDWNKSNGMSKFFGDIYKNPNNPFHNKVNEIFTEEDKKYFDGFIEIPVIPFISVSPNPEIAKNWNLEQYKEWATSGFLDNSKTIPNVSSLQNIVNETFIKLSEKANNVFKQKINLPNLKDIRKEYYKDYDIEYFLNQMWLNFSKSSNFTISDANNNTYIMAKNKYFSEQKVNKVVVNNGIELINNKIDKNYIELEKSINETFVDWQTILTDQLVQLPAGFTNVEEYQKYYFLNNNVFWAMMQIMKEIKLNTNDEIIEQYHAYISKVLDLNFFQKEFANWKLNALDFFATFRCNALDWNGGGYNVEFTRKNSMGIGIDFNATYYEPSSYLSVVSLNYSKLKNGTKQIVDSEFAKNAIKLPFKNRNINQDEVMDNFAQYKNHFIYNPYTQTTEFYNDFLDWLNKLDSKFKVDVNGEEFVIIGSGIDSEFVYPITSSNQLLINNDAPILFANDLGYDKIFANNTVYEQSHYFVNFKNRYDLISSIKTLNDVNAWTKRVSGEKLAYRIDDANQPNQLLFLRMNFPYKILNIVLFITCFIAAIVIILSFVFIFVLMRSIINQNMNTFAVGMANGISKRKLLFSFMPFVLIPSGVSALLGYGFSFLLYPIISNAIQSYWILDYIRFNFNFGYFILVFLLITLIIFAVQATVVYIMLNKNVSNLLNAKMEFKYNKLVQASHKLVSKLSPLASFRITYMLGNFGRLILLLLMMTSFVSLTTISASTTSTFNTAIQKTIDNKQYNYAIDLVTPSVQGGYYYDIPYNLVGSRQKGLTPLYDLNKTGGFYGKEYKEALTYNIPGTNESVVYNNLFLPEASIIGDVQGSITFFRNKVVNLLAMDFGINFVGNYINPWEWAKKILPTSVVNLIEQKLQKQLNLVFAYTCWLNQQGINVPEKDAWLYNLDNGNNFLENLNNSADPSKWDQSNWLVQLVKENNRWKWATNDQYLSNGLPNFTMTKQFANFMKVIISLDNNPNYKTFIKQLEKLQKRKIIDNNFMFGLNVVPVIPELDETYTYIDSTLKPTFNGIENIKIVGIKPNSNHVVLWNEYDGVDLKTQLQNYTIQNNEYPLIINEVVQKKYKLNVNDVIQVVANNKYDRYITKFENKPDVEKYKFKVLGVTTSKSEEQYYTTQEVANKILDFKKPELASSMDLKSKNYDYKWVNQEEINSYVPFNGVFSKQELPKMLANFLTLYSPSGLSPISGSLPTSGNGDTYWQLFMNYSEINKILKCNFADETKTKNLQNILAMCEEYKRVFDSNKYFSPALSGIDVTFASALLGDIMDSTVNDINLVCIVSLLPAILIIVILMSYMIVVESRRLVALLKVLGFSDWTNTITLSTVQFVVVGLAILLGYAFSAIVLAVLKTFAFNALSIIINPVIPWWTAMITIGILAAIVGTITATIYYSLRKSNPAQEIAMR